MDRKYKITQNLSYCLKETAKGCRKLPYLCMGVVLANCIIPIITAFLPKVIIEEIEQGMGLKRLLIITGTLALGLALAQTIQKYLERLVYWNKFKMNTHFLRKVTKKALTTDYRNQENEHFRELQTESFSSCNGNFSGFIQTYDAIIMFFSNFLGFVAFAGILFTLNVWVILFLCFTTSVSFLLNRKVLKWAEKNMDEKTGYEHGMQYIIETSNDTAAAKDIRLYNMKVWLDKRYNRYMEGLLRWYGRYTAKLFGVSAVDSGMSLIREGVVYLYLLYLVFKGDISVAEFVLYFNVVAGFSTWLGSLLGQINVLGRLNISMNRFRTYLEYPEVYKREDGEDIRADKNPRVIELKNVSFRYSEDGDDIIKDFNLKIAPGEHLAVVGLNGAGKTTMVKLIMGLTEPGEGTVCYDGRDVREYNRDKYYEIFGAVLQDHSILPVTISEIVAENDGSSVDRQKVMECLKAAGLKEKTDSLDKSINSKYDKTFWDDGISLSGGEQQKLLLARALYRNSPVVVLDEPTAALDPISENRLYETYNEMTKGKTTIFISHRLASTRFCNRIILIEDGRILEEGTHEELLGKKGRYYELYETQAKYYRDGAGGISSEENIPDTSKAENER
ncbi:MAG: ABC transporter ATP-binding protein/permease [Lachnospiraceae bacterium]|nr:ABC transporter ATP-binding protein/permease [Lachnospiraceae bacterium]